MTTISRVFVLFLIVIQKSDSSSAQLTDIESELAKFFKDSYNWLDKNGKYFVDIIEENEQNISTNCAKHLVRMITNATRELWAAKMLDSNGHLPSGTLSGTLTDLGDFDQCIKISETFHQNNSIEGKYCLLTIKPKNVTQFSGLTLNESNFESEWFVKEFNDWIEVNNHFSFSNGICFPSVCPSNQILILLKKFFLVLNYFDVELDYCQTSAEPTHRVEVYICFAIIKSILGLVVLGTILDMCSTISNQKIDSEYRLQFVHGLRVLGTVWVILAHSSGFILVTILTRISPFAHYPDDAIENSKTVLSQYILNASLAVQIFFTMSGFLTVYSTLSKKRLEMSFIPFVLLRWLRFTPPLIGMMCFTICLQLFGSGPLFQKDLLKPFVDPCIDNWWAHILFVSNWFDLRQMCGVQTWYLGADFQLHIISFIVIYFFNKNQSISQWLSYSLILLGALIPVVLVGSGVAGIPRVDVLFKPKYEVPGLETTLFFFGTHIHLISYFFGSLLGFALLNRKFISIKKNFNRIIWLLVTILVVSIPALSYPILQEDIHPINHTISNAIAMGLMLIIWSVCMVWILYNCAINRAKVLSKILSANFLHPLSRLSFCAYLTHIMLIWFNVQQIRYPIVINALTIGQYYCTVLVETFILSFFLYLTFEAPFVNIIKIIFTDKNVIRNTAEEEVNNHSVDSQNTINLKNVSNNNY